MPGTERQGTPKAHLLTVKEHVLCVCTWAEMCTCVEGEDWQQAGTGVTEGGCGRCVCVCVCTGRGDPKSQLPPFLASLPLFPAVVSMGPPGGLTLPLNSWEAVAAPVADPHL